MQSLPLGLAIVRRRPLLPPITSATATTRRTHSQHVSTTLHYFFKNIFTFHFFTVFFLVFEFRFIFFIFSFSFFIFVSHFRLHLPFTFYLYIYLYRRSTSVYTRYTSVVRP